VRTYHIHFIVLGSVCVINGVICLGEGGYPVGGERQLYIYHIVSKLVVPLANMHSMLADYIDFLLSHIYICGQESHASTDYCCLLLENSFILWTSQNNIWLFICIYMLGKLSRERFLNIMKIIFKQKGNHRKYV